MIKLIVRFSVTNGLKNKGIEELSFSMDTTPFAGLKTANISIFPFPVLSSFPFLIPRSTWRFLGRVNLNLSNVRLVFSLNAVA